MFHLPLPISCLGTAILLVLLPVAGLTGQSAKPHSSPSELSADQLLEKVVYLEDRIAFSGTQTVVFDSGVRSEATITDEWYLPGNRCRIVYRLPKNVAGKVLVSQGATQWELETGRGTAVKTTSTWQPMTAQRASAIVARIRSSYQLELSPQPTIVAGRPARLVSFLPRKQDRNRQAWWIDQHTQAVLKREVYAEGGRIHSSSSYSNLRFSPAPSDYDVALRLPAGVKTTVRDAQQPVLTLARARQSAPAWASVRNSLVYGFEFESASTTSVQGTAAFHCQYSDGLVGVSLVHFGSKAHIPSESGGSRSVRIGSATGRIIDHSRFKIISWTLPNTSMSLIGDLPEATLVALARGLM